MRGGRRPGAGRKPGVPNSGTSERIKYLGPVGERAIAVVVDAMQNPAAPWSSRVQAAGMAADRAFGHAPTSVSFEVTKRLNDLTIEERRARLKLVLRRSLHRGDAAVWSQVVNGDKGP